MPTPRNGVSIVLGEMSLITFAIRRSTKMSGHSHQDEDHDPIMTNFTRLKQLLMTVSDLSQVDANTFLRPFLDVIRSEDTTGPITGLALSSINKILSYELVSLSSVSAASAVENIADAVTHARFVGTDPGSDEVVLMKILQVLRTLLLSSAGSLMSNESVCDIMQSCFRICFEVRLSELLRRTAEHALMDMTQLLFARLPLLKEAQGNSTLIIRKSLKRTVNDGSHGRGRRERKVLGGSRKSRVSPSNVLANNASSHNPPVIVSDKQSGSQQEVVKNTVTNAETCRSVDENQISEMKKSQDGEANVTEAMELLKVNDQNLDYDSISMASDIDNQEMQEDNDSLSKGDNDDHSDVSETSQQPSQSGADVINEAVSNSPKERAATDNIVPYGLACVRELLRFLVSLINPQDRRNVEGMIHMGLSLITMALESGATYIGDSPSLLTLVKDELCRYLFLLLQRENLSLFASSLRVCFFLFESMRGHLKFQLEAFVLKLMDLITSDTGRYAYEVKELSLESIVQLCRLPNLVAELYINFDCDMYSNNVFEELIKMLSKHAYPASGSYLVHILALEALLSVINIVENHCNAGCEAVPPQKLLLEKIKTNEVAKQDSIDTISNTSVTSYDLPAPKELIQIKQRKKLMQAATEQFNMKPKNGLKFMQEHGLINSPLEAKEVAALLRENRRLSKKMIGDYIGDRKNQMVLEAFVKSFSFEETTSIQDALRAFLETFRLPGESPIITRILEAFSNNWFISAGEPFGNKDAAFTLAYAIIMLNVDQHNENIKKQAAMTVEDFKRNLRGVNNNADFLEEMLEEIFTSIKNEEIVMPSEQTGQVRDDYNWKMLLQRSSSKEGIYKFVNDGRYDQDLFLLIWGPTVAALSYIFDNATDDMIVQKAVNGFRRCALISSHYGLTKVFDSLIISLCKSTLLMNPPEKIDSLSIMFGNNYKAQLAARTVFFLSHRFGDILREGWGNILNCILHLYRARLLPALMVDAEDFVDPTGHISIMPDEMANTKSDGSLFSSFYQYFAEAASGRTEKPEEIEAQERAHACIKECHPEFLITESKFLRIDSLVELIKALTFGSRGAAAHENLGTHYDEEAAVFYLELLMKVIIQNRDRIHTIWKGVKEHLSNLILSNEYNFLTERAVVGQLRLAMRLLRREEMAREAISALQIILLMKPNVLRFVCKQVTYGICELIRSNVTNILGDNCWNTLLSILEVTGAGAKPPSVSQIKMSRSLDALTGAVETLERDQCELGSSISIADSETSSISTQASVFGGSAHSISQNLSLFSLPTFSTASSSLVNVSDPGNTTVGTTAYHGRNFFVVVNKDNENQYDLSLSDELNKHDTRCLTKCCETLGFLIRDTAHMTPSNFPGCVHSLRILTEATANGSVNRSREGLNKADVGDKKNVKNSKYKTTKRIKDTNNPLKKRSQSSDHMSHSTLFDITHTETNLDDCYYCTSMQLLDLMHTLHIKASSVYESAVLMNSDKASVGNEEQDSEECHRQQSDNESNENTEIQGSKLARDSSVNGEAKTVSKKPTQSANKIDAHFLWTNCWCPLLQGMATMCLDTRKDVRNSALTNLQRGLLIHDMQKLSAVEWEACFNQVLFPMLSKLIAIPNTDASAVYSNIEETRMRAAALLSKVFLQHLTQLLTLSTFTALWLTILDFMEKCMHADKTGLLSEAIPESLKNMLLVMVTAGIFDEDSKIWSEKNVTSEKMVATRIEAVAASEDNKQNEGVKQDEKGPVESPKRSQLWSMTWERISLFLPYLKEELFGHTNIDAGSITESQTVPSDTTTELPSNNQENVEAEVNVNTTENSNDQRRVKSMPELSEVNNSVCVVLQPPLPSLQNNRTNDSSDSLVTNQNLTGNVPILLTPSVISGTANKLPVTAIPKANLAASNVDGPSSPPSPAKNQNESKPIDNAKPEDASPMFSI